jgi:hypothetical protein
MIHPSLLPLPDNIHIEESAVGNGMINLNKFSQEMLLQMTLDNRKAFIAYLSQQPVKIRYIVI